jgi:hypothetical protein
MELGGQFTFYSVSAAKANNRIDRRHLPVAPRQNKVIRTKPSPSGSFDFGISLSGLLTATGSFFAMATTSIATLHRIAIYTTLR